MFFLWVLFLIAAIVLFVEPQRRYALRSPGRDIMRPLLNETNSFTRAAPIQTNHKLTDADGTVVCLWIYFVLKLVQEGFQTAAPLYAAAQFGWTDGDVGGLLAVIGIIVLPTNLFVGWISNRVSDRTSQVLALVGILAGCWMSVDHFNRPLTERQYVTGALLLFVSAQILEGVNMGLLSKVMPKVMSRGLWNSGFLSTEAGTFGRVMGAGMITLFGSISSNEANIQRSIMVSTKCPSHSDVRLGPAPHDTSSNLLEVDQTGADVSEDGRGSHSGAARDHWRACSISLGHIHAVFDNVCADGFHSR